MFGWGKQKDVGVVLPHHEGMGEAMWNGEMDEDGGATTVCAWCLAEHGIAPDPADSHGICVSHRALVWQAYRERKTR